MNIEEFNLGNKYLEQIAEIENQLIQIDKIKKRLEIQPAAAEHLSLSFNVPTNYNDYDDKFISVQFVNLEVIPIILDELETWLKEKEIELREAFTKL